MKRLFLSLMTLSAFAFLAGCTVNKDFSVSFDKEFVAANASTSYSKTDTLDVTKSSSDYAKYKSDIKTVEIQSATYTILSTSGSPTQKIVNATLTITNIGGTTTKTLATVSDVNLQSVLGVAQPLPLTDDGKQFLQDQLMGSTSSAIITFAGTSNEGPVMFTVSLHMNLKVTYSKTIP
jgi:hypothetical protein